VLHEDLYSKSNQNEAAHCVKTPLQADKTQIATIMLAAMEWKCSPCSTTTATLRA
jgi:hypothetical protein